MKKLTRREKILLGVSIVGIGVAGYFGYKYNINNLKNRLDESNIIALRSLNREKQGSIFEIKQLKDYINNLNPDININRFVNIPEDETVATLIYNHLLLTFIFARKLQVL